MIVTCPTCGKQIKTRAQCGATNCSHCNKPFIFDREVWRRRHWKLVPRTEVPCPRCGKTIRTYKSTTSTGVTGCTRCGKNFPVNEHGVSYLREKVRRNGRRYGPRRYRAEIERIKQLKTERMELLGGKCCACGYNRYRGALEFHHLNPAHKRRTGDQYLRGFDPRNYLLLCSRCHRELEAGLIDIMSLTGESGRQDIPNSGQYIS